jgi:hypothetical protein
MSELKGHKPTVAMEFDFRLSLEEARALDALTGYGTDAFLDAFYKSMGEAYLRPHEAGLRSLFAGLRRDLPPLLGRALSAEQAINGVGK